jgi:uncharacterized protein YerC
LGRVKSLVGYNGHNYYKRKRYLNPYKQKAGKNYYRYVVKLSKNKVKKDFKVHRLVAEAFIDKIPGKDKINHKDGNPLNNNAKNLEWVSQKENINHSIENGLKIRVIDTITREAIVEFLNNGYSYDEISEELGVSKTTVFNYIKRFEIKKIYR